MEGDEPKKEPTDPNLNEWEDQEKGNEPKKYVTVEEYKELQSNIERGMQKVLKQSKERERELETLKKVVQEVWSVSQDPAYLVELHEREPEVAQKILDQYYWGIDIDSFEEQLTWVKKTPKIDAKKIKEEAKQELRQEMEKESVQKKFKKLVEKLEIEWEDLKKFTSTYNELVDGRDIKPDQVFRFAKLAHIEVFGVPPSDTTKKIAWVMATWSWSNWASQTPKITPEENLIADMRKFMQWHWIKLWV